jgi:hypothetical protein
MKFGYETDSSWLDDLQMVKDKEFISHKTENIIKENYKKNYGAMFNFGLEKININPDKTKKLLQPILNLIRKKSRSK